MIASVVYFVLLFSVFIPFMEDPARPYYGFAYSALGGNLSEAILFLFQHPLDSLRMLFENHRTEAIYDGVKKEFYIVFLLSGGLILFYRPQYLLMFIPIIAQKMWNDHPVRWGIGSFYTIEICSILSLYVFVIISNLNKVWLRYSLAGLVCVLATFFTFYKFKNGNRTWANYFLEKEVFYDAKMYQQDFDVNKVHHYLKSISDTAAVCATESLAPHIAYRRKITCFPYVRDSKYLAFLLDHNTFPLTSDVFKMELDKYLKDDSWERVIDDYPFLLLHKKDKTEKGNTNAKYGLTIFSDAEKLSQDNMNVAGSIDMGTIYFGGRLHSDEYAFSGKYSVKLLPEDPYGFSYVLNNLKMGDNYEISVRRKGHDTKSYLVVAHRDANMFYMANTNEVPDPTGWSLLKVNFQVPQHLVGENVTVYVWNADKVPVYFDDLKIVKY